MQINLLIIRLVETSFIEKLKEYKETESCDKQFVKFIEISKKHLLIKFYPSAIFDFPKEF